MKKYILKQIILILITLLILSGGLLFLLNTEQGLHTSFMLASKIIPGKLTTQKLNGRLLGPINIDKFYFENKTLTISADTIYLEWNIQDLFLGKINIIAMHANNIKINTKTPNINQPKLTLKDMLTNLKELHLPMQLKLGDIQLQNIIWQQDTHAPIKVTSFILRSHITKENSISLDAKLDSQAGSALIQGTIQDAWDINWKLNISNLKIFAQEIEGSVVCEGKIYGKRNNPEINAAIKIFQFKYNNVSFAKLHANANIDLSNKKISQFTLSLDSAKIKEINFNQLTFSGHGEFNQQGFSAKSKILISQHEPISIELKLPKLQTFAALSDEQLLDIQIMWQTHNLAFLQTILPSIKNINGALSLKYRINGTLKDPKIDGMVQVTDARFLIPELNTKFKNIDLTARNIGNKITYQIAIHSGSGVLNLSGETLFSQDTVNSKTLINGTDFLVINTHEYKIIVFPQLVLQTKDAVLDLTGKIFIPEAIIKPGYLSMNNLLPAEVVYAKKTPDKKPTNLDLHANIQLNLGENVSLGIMGLKGKIQGQLQLVDDPQKTTKAFGTLYIKDANYNIYGQQLKITRGNLHFFGGAIDNPEVDIEAIRDFKAAATSTTFFGSSDKELTVGIRMHGILDKAKIDLFSMPEGLAKPDILSYLIIGQPSKQASENKAQLLLQAASAMNFGGTGEITNFVNTLRDKLGFSELGITEEARINKPREIVPSKLNQPTKPGDALTTNTAFALGRYLTPKIYVGYSIGFLDPVNTFRVRYHMGRYWSIQTESSSLGSGADLLYTIERD